MLLLLLLLNPRYHSHFARSGRERSICFSGYNESIKARRNFVFFFSFSNFSRAKMEIQIAILLHSSLDVSKHRWPFRCTIMHLKSRLCRDYFLTRYHLGYPFANVCQELKLSEFILLSYIKVRNQGRARAHDAGFVEFSLTKGRRMDIREISMLTMCTILHPRDDACTHLAGRIKSDRVCRRSPLLFHIRQASNFSYDRIKSPRQCPTVVHTLLTYSYFLKNAFYTEDQPCHTLPREISTHVSLVVNINTGIPART